MLTMQNTLVGSKPLTLLESIQVANQTQVTYASQLSRTFDTLMHPDESLFWEYPGHLDYSSITGWHPLGTA